MVKRYQGPVIVETDDDGSNPVSIFIGPDKSEIRSDAADYAAAVVGAAPMFAAPVQLLKVATFGDSTATPTSITGSETTDQRQFNTALGSTTTTRFRVMGRDALFTYYPAARLVAVGGISGQGVESMLGRDALSPSATRRAMSDLVQFQPDIVLLRGGSVNNINLLAVDATDADVDDIINKHMQIVDSLVSLGLRVLDEGIYGLGGADSAVVLRRRAAIVRFNAAVKSAIATRDQDRVRFLDLLGVTHDSTGNYLTSVSYDGVHPDIFGCDAVARVEAAAITKWFGRSGTRSYASANLLNNTVKSLALMSETTTSGTNKTPLGFAIASSGGGVAANFDVVYEDGKKWWVGQASTGTPGGAVTMSLPDGFESGATYPIPITGGDIIGLEFDLLIETLDGSEFDALVDFFVRFDVRNTGTGRVAIDWTKTGLTYTGMGGRLQWHVAMPPVQISDASADLAATSVIQVVLKPAVGQTLRFGIADVHMAKISV